MKRNMITSSLAKSTSKTSLYCLMAVLLAGGSQAVAHGKGDDARKRYSPMTGQNFPTNVYFGDTHNHTANSGDAFMRGNRLGPEEAYRFARGDEVLSNTGIPAKINRPLDFLVVADHVEGLGVMYEVFNGNPLLMDDETLIRWNKAMKKGGKAAVAIGDEVVVRQGDGTLPTPLTNPKVAGPVMHSVWQEYTKTAERYNDPGKFTAMIGYEWTSVPGGNNLHRNVLFRGGKASADAMMPYTSWQSQDPEKLWDWMERFEEVTGDRVLAIPHNGNLSGARMFEPTKFDGSPIDKEYAERRARWEVLQEMMQTKGNSETHPTLSPNDEFADYGLAGWEYGNLSLTDKLETPEQRPYMYLRGGLQQGLKWEEELGVNPFKFGFAGGTDIHTSLTAIEEDNFYGKHVNQEPSKDRWSHVSKKGLGKTRYTWQYTAAGLTAVWATDNTREDLWDSMYRKEVYATSGSRMKVRFFGGWDYDQTDADSQYFAKAGYSKGVPMGSDLPKATKGKKAPTFLVAAMKDAESGNIDRVQVVKGWLTKDGELKEQIYNVAWGDADTRKLDAEGNLPSVGDTVNVEEATWTNTIGTAELTQVWTDPDFDPSIKAFYYARAIEIPTPRWTAYDQKRLGAKMSADVPMKHQERAWTSPIWYTADK